MMLVKLVTHQKVKLNHFCTQYAKFNPKWIKCLHTRPEFIKIQGIHKYTMEN